MYTVKAQADIADNYKVEGVIELGRRVKFDLYPAKNSGCWVDSQLGLSAEQFA